jgi:hypothetical protein
VLKEPHTPVGTAVPRLEWLPGGASAVIFRNSCHRASTFGKVPAERLSARSHLAR